METAGVRGAGAAQIAAHQTRDAKQPLSHEEVREQHQRSLLNTVISRSTLSERRRSGPAWKLAARNKATLRKDFYKSDVP